MSINIISILICNKSGSTTISSSTYGNSNITNSISISKSSSICNSISSSLNRSNNRNSISSISKCNRSITCIIISTDSASSISSRRISTNRSNIFIRSNSICRSSGNSFSSCSGNSSLFSFNSKWY